MYCPECGCEYQDGFNECSECGVELVYEKPLNVKKGINVNLSKRYKMANEGVKTKKTITAKLSLGFVLLGILYITVLTMKDCYHISGSSSHNSNSYSFIETNVLILINLVGLLLGIISLCKKENRKKVVYAGIIINSILPITLLVEIVIKLTR